MFFNKQIIWLLWAPIKTKAQKITIATATATAGKGWEKNIRNKDQATIVAHNKQMQLQVAVAVCSCSLRYIATATDTTHAYTYVERQSYCCCYCILTANANWLDKLLLLLLLLLLFNDRDRKMPPHFEAPLGIGCEKQRRRRCNACGLKYLIALYCGWMRRVLKIFTHKPHTHTLPHSVYFTLYTYNSCGTAVHPVEAEVSECLRFSHHFLSFCVRCCCRCNRSHQTKGYRCAIYVLYICSLQLFV